VIRSHTDPVRADFAVQLFSAPNNTRDWKGAIQGVPSCPGHAGGLRAKAEVVRAEVHHAGVVYVDGTMTARKWHERLPHSLACDIPGGART